METISEFSGNVFADLGFSAAESALLAMLDMCILMCIMKPCAAFGTKPSVKPT